MKGLLIAYAMPPLKTVGALRPGYWAEEIAAVSDISLDVITATPSEVNTIYNRFVVPNEKTSIWSSLIKDEGLAWKKSLKSFFAKHGVNQYEFVILTGGPFFHFSIGKYFKSKGLKVIYDFRDPFSYNPRHNDRGIKRLIKTRFERNCLKSADLVVTVNEACHTYIGPGLKVKRAIIPNGYDERIVTKEIKEIKPSVDLFYAGRFYWEPTHFFEILKDKQFTLHHAGHDQSFTHPYIHSHQFTSLGMLEQKEMFKELAKAEIGVVFTIDVPFESTTKIFDYLALGMKILVITLGQPNVGVLKRELEGYPMYRWVRNDYNEILNAIQELKALPRTQVDTSRYSRHESLLQLVNEIKQLF